MLCWFCRSVEGDKYNNTLLPLIFDHDSFGPTTSTRYNIIYIHSFVCVGIGEPAKRKIRSPRPVAGRSVRSFDGGQNGSIRDPGKKNIFGHLPSSIPIQFVFIFSTRLELGSLPWRGESFARAALCARRARRRRLRGDQLNLAVARRYGSYFMGISFIKSLFGKNKSIDISSTPTHNLSSWVI